MQTLNNINIAKNFNLKEFECPCCKRVMIDNRLLKFIVLFRIMVNRPIYISSGYRCRHENDRVGGYKDSYHLIGMAADIKVNDITINNLAEMAGKFGFNGIGEYKNHLHLDVRTVKFRWKG